MFGFIKSRIEFPEGTVRFGHRYALIVEIGQETFSIGFESALEPGIDRLIHPNSMERVNRDHTTKSDLLPSEKSAVMSLVLRYCEKNKLTYRIVE